MQTLLPLADKIGARLKARGETIAIAESSTGGLVPRRWAVHLRCLGLFPGWQRDLHRLCAVGLSGHPQSIATADRTRFDRALRFAVGQFGARTVERDLGCRRDGCDRPHGKSLRG